MLTVLETLPDSFLHTPARELHRLFSGPTLIHLPGRREAPLLVSVLLHGNEDSGGVAMQRVLRNYTDRQLAGACSPLVGDGAAGRAGVRPVACA